MYLGASVANVQCDFGALFLVVNVSGRTEVDEMLSCMVHCTNYSVLSAKAMSNDDFVTYLYSSFSVNGAGGR